MGGPWKSEYGKTMNDKRRGTLRSDHLKRYGLTPAVMEEMERLQEGRCAICHRTPQEAGKRRRLCVDHDHDSGAVRGLLCQNCNTALGLLGDSLDVLQVAVEYRSEPLIGLPAQEVAIR